MGGRGKLPYRLDVTYNLVHSNALAIKVCHGWEYHQRFPSLGRLAGYMQLSESDDLLSLQV